jgi:hypothetical protein
MKRRLLVSMAAAAAVASVAALPAARGAVALDDFEKVPNLAQGPNIYVAVPAMQTITTPEATYTGGVVLGFATFFPAISFATPPNVYGTANFGNGLPEKLSIDVNAANPTTEVSFALFNGEVFNQSYTVNAFDGTTLVGTQHLLSVPPNFNSGYALIDLTAPAGITNLTVTPDGAPSAWDFLIDSVAFNQSLSAVVPNPDPTLPPPPPPPPGPQPPEPPQPPETVQVEVPIDVHGKEVNELETETVEVDFGDDPTRVKGQVAPAPAPVPEPAMVSMFVGGAMGMLLRRRR